MWIEIKIVHLSYSKCTFSTPIVILGFLSWSRACRPLRAHAKTHTSTWEPPGTLLPFTDPTVLPVICPVDPVSLSFLLSVCSPRPQCTGSSYQPLPACSGEILSGIVPSGKGGIPSPQCIIF